VSRRPIAQATTGVGRLGSTLQHQAESPEWGGSTSRGVEKRGKHYLVVPPGRSESRGGVPCSHQKGRGTFPLRASKNACEEIGGKYVKITKQGREGGKRRTLETQGLE